MMLSVADELLWESLPDNVKRIAEYHIAARLESASQSAFNEGWSQGDGAGYQRGFEAGIAEGQRRERAKKTDVA